MFGLGMGEVVIILVLALLLLGPQRLPDAAKQIGKGLREFRKATEDLKNQFESELYATDEHAKPSLVPPEASKGPQAFVPEGGVPGPAGEVPAARADNVPGLDAALVEVTPPEPTPAAAATAKAS